MLKWIGTIASIAGSFIVAMKLSLLGYCLFIIGSVSWLYVGFRQRETSLMVLNGTFMCANILGLYNAY